MKNTLIANESSLTSFVYFFTVLPFDEKHVTELSSSHILRRQYLSLQVEPCCLAHSTVPASKLLLFTNNNSSLFLSSQFIDWFSAVKFICFLPLHVEIVLYYTSLHNALSAVFIPIITIIN